MEIYHLIKAGKISQLKREETTEENYQPPTRGEIEAYLKGYKRGFQKGYKFKASDFVFQFEEYRKLFRNEERNAASL